MYIKYDENSVEFEFLVNEMQEYNFSKAVQHRNKENTTTTGEKKIFIYKEVLSVKTMATCYYVHKITVISFIGRTIT